MRRSTQHLAFSPWSSCRWELRCFYCHWTRNPTKKPMERSRPRLRRKNLRKWNKISRNVSPDVVTHSVKEEFLPGKFTRFGLLFKGW